MNIVTKLASKAAGVLFAKLTGSKDGADVCSTIVEWLVGRARESKAATIKTLSTDIANALATTTRQVPGQPDADAVIDNAFEALAAGPTVAEIVADHRREAKSAATVTCKILATRFKAKADPVYERAVVLIAQFYETLLKQPKFAELAEPAFQHTVLSDFRALRDGVDKMCEGTESLETLQLGLPAAVTASLRRTASNLLLDAKQSTWNPSDSRLSLLLATNRVIEFERREDLLNDLHQWCEATGDVDLRLIVGPGGTGKTRLMIEACDRLWRDLGWRAGFLRPTKDTHRDTLYRALLDDARPLMAVFDYAELRIEEVQDFVACARQRASAGSPSASPVRIVLLSRDAGDWWTTSLPTRRDAVADFFTDLGGRADSVLRLPPIAGEPGDRAGLFDQWRKAFAAKLGTDPAVGVSSEWRTVLAQRGMDRSLFIALAALAAVDSRDGEIPTSIEALLQRTIHNERSLWQSHLGANLANPAADALAAITLLMGSPDRDRTRALIAALPSFHGQPRTVVHQVFETLRVLYPDEQHWGIVPVQPDLIGEYLIDRRLRAEPGILDVLLSSPPNVQPTLTTLTRMAQSWRGIVPDVAVEARRWLEQALGGDLAGNIEAAIDVALSTGDPIGQVLAAALRGRGDTGLAGQALTYAHSKTDSGNVDVLALRELNVEAALLVRHTMKTAIDQSDGLSSELASFTTNLAVFLSRLNRREDALAAAKEAADLYCALANARPEVFIPSLATSFNNVATMLSELNRHEDALAVGQGAAELYRALADARPEVFTPELAMSFHNLANRLSKLNRREDALAAAQKSAELYRALAGARPEVFTPNLAGSLYTLANRLSELNRPKDALAAAEEAAVLYRALADARPEVFTPNLAVSLNSLGNRLTGLNRPEDALAAAQEAADLYRALADARPEVFTPGLAMSLYNLGSRLSGLNRPEDALAAAQEAVDLYRPLADARPEVFTPDLAGSLNNLANRLSELKRHEDALAAAQEAVVLRRALADAHPEVFTPELAMSLNNLANKLSGLNRREDAIAAAQEATDLYRALADARPEVFIPHLAMSLHKLGDRLSELNRREDSLAATQEAADLYRALIGA